MELAQHLVHQALVAQVVTAAAVVAQAAVTAIQQAAQVALAQY
jgi:hypothetical protein